VPAYLYLFDHCDSAMRERDLCAFHASELPYVFGHVRADAELPPNWPRPVGAARKSLSSAMIDYWVSFARTGRPRSERGPPWPAYDAARQSYMHFGDAPSSAGTSFRACSSFTRNSFAAAVPRGRSGTPRSA
jgi:para-nitrobenzyl esterase